MHVFCSLVHIALESKIEMFLSQITCVNSQTWIQIGEKYHQFIIIEYCDRAIGSSHQESQMVMDSG
jgi:hypothetical protein